MLQRSQPRPALSGQLMVRTVDSSVLLASFMRTTSSLLTLRVLIDITSGCSLKKDTEEVQRKQITRFCKGNAGMCRV
uniref:Uncharacterized protein n=1 Tax=Rhizophora mucronata TaxID=61149 RepID=A0A2P2QPT0_RHIMU